MKGKISVLEITLLEEEEEGVVVVIWTDGVEV